MSNDCDLSNGKLWRKLQLELRRMDTVHAEEILCKRKRGKFRVCRSFSLTWQESLHPVYLLVVIQVQHDKFERSVLSIFRSRNQSHTKKENRPGRNMCHFSIRIIEWIDRHVFKKFSNLYRKSFENLIGKCIRRVIDMQRKSIHKLSNINQTWGHMDNIRSIKTTIMIMIKYTKKN